MKFPKIKRKYRFIKLKFYWSTLYPLKYNFYWFFVKHLQWWPLETLKSKTVSNLTGKKRIAYYLWEFPSLSQTFIQREINALANSVGEVLVFCDVAGNDFLDQNKKINPIVLLPGDKKENHLYKKYFFRKNPFRYANLFLFTLFHNYHSNKTYKFDKDTFLIAICLAGSIKEKNINHIHSPWADRCAFIALIASRLSGVSYSIQARAHDIHRKDYLCGLKEKFENADFVVTNTQYNYNYIHSEICPSINGKLNLVYNGISLEKFVPGIEKKNPEIIKLLCVARLIEQKGLIYLLEACKKLKDKGHKFICEIIGGPESLYMNYYLELKKLHDRFNLRDQVFFLDALPFNKIMDYYMQADIFILPCALAEDGSRDITPNSLIEAMAMKLPVISTNITGVPEIVDDDINGILIPPNNIEVLVNAIEKLIQQPLLRKQLGENARKKVEERFDINKNISKYVYLFEKGLVIS